MSEVDLIRRAFSVQPPTDHERLLLQTLAANPGKGSIALATIVGYRHYGAWNLHFGKICTRRFPQRSSFQSGAIAEYDATDDTWTMKTAALEALIGLGIVS